MNIAKHLTKEFLLSAQIMLTFARFANRNEDKLANLGEPSDTSEEALKEMLMGFGTDIYLSGLWSDLSKKLIFTAAQDYWVQNPDVSFEDSLKIARKEVDDGCGSRLFGDFDELAGMLAKIGHSSAGTLADSTDDPDSMIALFKAIVGILEAYVST